jgi:pimeloyl-ACP methyl ester carboxylesterase
MEAVECSIPTSGGGTLAARFYYPRTLGVPRTAPALPAALATASRGACALVVHQYSVMGGSQDLMRGIARAFTTQHGVCALTFNLRGVGGSSGRCTLTGHGEADDVADVGAWLQSAGFDRILLVCSSAGAPIGGSALDRVPAFTACVPRAVPRATRAHSLAGAAAPLTRMRVLRPRCCIPVRRLRYVALGYVFGFWASILFGGHYRAVLDSTKPKLFVQGSNDEFTYPKTLLEARAALQRAMRLAVAASALTQPRVSRVAAQWAAPQSKSAVTETRILPGLGHFQARAVPRQRCVSTCVACA